MFWDKKLNWTSFGGLIVCKGKRLLAKKWIEFELMWIGRQRTKLHQIFFSFHFIYTQNGFHVFIGTGMVYSSCSQILFPLIFHVRPKFVSFWINIAFHLGGRYVGYFRLYYRQVDHHSTHRSAPFDWSTFLVWFIGKKITWA